MECYAWQFFADLCCCVQVYNDQQESLYGAGVRKVPINYVGFAQSVYFKGTFDGWGTGLRLACQDMGNNVINEFTGELYVLPGRYEVKFWVDGQWRLAGEGWETVKDEGTGLENNVLEVL